MSVANGNSTDWRVLRDRCLEDVITARRPKIRGKTRGQAAFVRSIEENVVTLADGPAGSGKTFIPCGLAAERLRDRKVERVVLTRPLVTCSGRRGAGVGFLPGELSAKVAPFMRPMLDVLLECMTAGELEKMLKDDAVEIVPLDYMRGVSLKNAMIVADEMQNAELDQWFMLLTRLGEGSKLVASGDSTQSDLHGGKSTVREAMRRLRGEPDIGIVHLSEEDVVRSDLVRRIVRRWNAR